MQPLFNNWVSVCQSREGYFERRLVLMTIDLYHLVKPSGSIKTEKFITNEYEYPLKKEKTGKKE